MRRLTITRRRTCRWATCSGCGGAGCTEYGPAAWDRYIAAEAELLSAEDQVNVDFKAGKATSDEVTAVLQKLAVHMLTLPGMECGDCHGVGSVRHRIRRARRRAGRRP